MAAQSLDLVVSSLSRSSLLRISAQALMKWHRERAAKRVSFTWDCTTHHLRYLISMGCFNLRLNIRGLDRQPYPFRNRNIVAEVRLVEIGWEC
ncbi:hypothetical protein G4B88_018888 [Cannabis sativa]|uniref:Uncharacterized protein n=1 Tax=Cannabis sativa TaxID=3483 RepID=A0A7J6DJL8_CANSA|nr:hypothetical protein G4B88_018888 [Cannabis sativa]